MSPVRREERDDRTLEGWDNWVDRAIREAQQRGEFDDLPGAGKPLQIYSNPLAPEWDAASGLLKGAGVAPFWVELDKEILAEVAALAAMRDEAAASMAGQLAIGQDGRAVEETVTPPPRPRWWPFRRARTRSLSRNVDHRHGRVEKVEEWRCRVRQAYLDRAAQLDKKIAAYHNALPGDLWWLQKPRLSPETAAKQFDEACPPLNREVSRTPDRGATPDKGEARTG